MELLDHHIPDDLQEAVVTDLRSMTQPEYDAFVESMADTAVLDQRSSPQSFLDADRWFQGTVQDLHPDTTPTFNVKPEININTEVHVEGRSHSWLYVMTLSPTPHAATMHFPENGLPIGASVAEFFKRTRRDQIKPRLLKIPRLWLNAISLEYNQAENGQIAKMQYPNDKHTSGLMPEDGRRLMYRALSPRLERI